MSTSTPSLKFRFFQAADEIPYSGLFGAVPTYYSRMPNLLILSSGSSNLLDESKIKDPLLPDIWLCIISHLSRTSLSRLSRVSPYFISQSASGAHLLRSGGNTGAYKQR